MRIHRWIPLIRAQSCRMRFHDKASFWFSPMFFVGLPVNYLFSSYHSSLQWFELLCFGIALNCFLMYGCMKFNFKLLWYISYANDLRHYSTLCIHVHLSFHSRHLSTAVEISFIVSSNVEEVKGIIFYILRRLSTRQLRGSSCMSMWLLPENVLVGNAASEYRKWCINAPLYFVISIPHKEEWLPYDSRIYPNIESKQNCTFLKGSK